jgi:hypothetical protein
MNAKILSVFFLMATPVVVGATLGFLDLAVVHRAQTPSLKLYDSIQINASWSQAKSKLTELSPDCGRSSSSATPPTLIHCSDSWWEYSFYFDSNDSSVRAKRFSPRDGKPFPFRMFH